MIYLITLIIFVFFPRPILINGSPSELAEFLKTHANIFYKILYADARIVAIANIFMLTPLIVVLSYAAPAIRMRNLLFFGTCLSLAIELVQFLIPGRVPDLIDFVSNTAGTVIALLLIRFLHRKA